MKRADEIRPEYDFASMKGGIRGKYAKRVREKTNVVILEPEIAEAFPNNDAVNQALRGVLNTAQALRRSGGSPAKPRRRPKALRSRRPAS